MTNPVLKGIAEKVIDPVIRFFNFPLAYLAGKSENMEKVILRPVMMSYSHHSADSIYQYTRLPKNVETMPVEWPNDGRFAGYAIVLQGPICTEDHFTVDTVKYYKRCYPGASIIVSTWTGSDPKAKKEIEEIGAFWVESAVPKNPGAWNINMQLTSSLAGVKKAKNMGSKYTMKTRTDQRMCSNDVLAYFRNLQITFPSADPQTLPERLVFISGAQTFRYLPFHICDFVAFGQTEELLKLYGIKNDERPSDFRKLNTDEVNRFNRGIAEKLEVSGSGSPYELYPDFEDRYYYLFAAEIFISYNYFSENIAPLQRGSDLMDAYYTFLKKYAIIADAEKLMIYWPKYETHATKYENEIMMAYKMTFKKWIDIYLHYEPKRDWTRPAGNDNARKN